MRLRVATQAATVAVLASVPLDAFEATSDYGVPMLTAGLLGAIGCRLLSAQERMHTVRAESDDGARQYDRGYEAGYDAGYVDGRKVAKPTVVPMCKHCRQEEKAAASPRVAMLS